MLDLQIYCTPRGQFKGEKEALGGEDHNRGRVDRTFDSMNANIILVTDTKFVLLGFWTLSTILAFKSQHFRN
jgi:hypothetical protein